MLYNLCVPCYCICDCYVGVNPMDYPILHWMISLVLGSMASHHLTRWFSKGLWLLDQLGVSALHAVPRFASCGEARFAGIGFLTILINLNKYLFRFLSRFQFIMYTYYIISAYQPVKITHFPVLFPGASYIHWLPMAWSRLQTS